MRAPCTVRRICEGIALSHPLPHWLVLEEFPLGAGTRSRGTPRIDVLAIKLLSGAARHNCNPVIRHAYEIKISRKDFLDELRHPAKRKKAYAICDYYSFAVPEGMVEEEEVPSECGLISIDSSMAAVIVEKAAPRLSSAPPSAAFMMDVARRAYQIGRREGAATCSFERFDMLCDLAQMFIKNEASATERKAAVLRFSRVIAGMQRHSEARELARIASGELPSPPWYFRQTLETARIGRLSADSEQE